LTVPIAHAYKWFEDQYMINPLRRSGRTPNGMPPGFDSLLLAVGRPLQMAAWLVLPAVLILAVGCGGGSSKKAKDTTTVAEADTSQEEEKEAPAPAPPPKKKFKIVEKAAEPEPSSASTSDFSKWEKPDLEAALTRKDILFTPAVVLYAARGPNDPKRADELDALVRKVARMKDDPSIPLAIPAGAYAAADTESPEAPAKANPAATAPAKKGRPAMRFGGRGGGGK
jgi:hypothetical protein